MIEIVFVAETKNERNKYSLIASKIEYRSEVSEETKKKCSIEVD